MSILNGCEVIDYPAGSLVDQSIVDVFPEYALIMDGTTNIRDDVHLLAATMVGGVGGSFAAVSNFRGQLGRMLPVIAEATDNLDANADCIFSPWAGITWAAINGAAIAANTDGEYGSSSALLTCGAAADGGMQLACVTVAAQPYTCSCRVKANNAGAVGENLRINFDGTTADVTLTANWQTLKVTDAAASGVAINAQIYFTAGENGDEVLISAWQRENKAYQTPWAYDSRTACTCAFSTASLGMVAAAPVTLAVACETPWVGNDGVRHDLLTNYTAAGGGNGLLMQKEAGNNLAMVVYSNGATKSVGIALTAVNWAADTIHRIVATIDAANTQRIWLDGVEGLISGGVSGRETQIGANLMVGTRYTGGTFPVNGSIAAAALNRVVSPQEAIYISSAGAWFPRVPLAVS